MAWCNETLTLIYSTSSVNVPGRQLSGTEFHEATQRSTLLSMSGSTFPRAWKSSRIRDTSSKLSTTSCPKNRREWGGLCGHFRSHTQHLCPSPCPPLRCNGEVWFSQLAREKGMNLMTIQSVCAAGRQGSQEDLIWALVRQYGWTMKRADRLAALNPSRHPIRDQGMLFVWLFLSDQSYRAHFQHSLLQKGESWEYHLGMSR